MLDMQNRAIRAARTTTIATAAPDGGVFAVRATVFQELKA